MTVTVRFAPSPTGLLHVGNARQALINWLFASSRGGTYILRIDDTDQERSKQEYVDAIQEDLTWLGLDWGQIEFQSKRTADYEAAAEKLKQDGRLYACYETPEELELKRKRQLSMGRPPVYDRAALSLSDEDKAKYEAEGRSPHWRFELNHVDTTWDDLVRGPTSYNGAHLSDPVLIRADGTLLYMLPSVVDDIDMAITHVLRGEDHVTNTVAQIQLAEALGATAPGWGHISLLTDKSGKGLSKRLGSLSLSDLRESGLEAMSVTSLLAKLGTSDAVDARGDIQDLVNEFDLGHFSRATPKFDPADLEFLNAKVLHMMAFEEAKPRLSALGVEQAVLDSQGEAFWNAVRPNLKQFKDVLSWWSICFTPTAPSIEDTTFIAQAADLLPDDPWDQETWGQWTSAVKAATDRKGKGLFLPLRMALTGMPHGPELGDLLPILGRERVMQRLKGLTA